MHVDTQLLALLGGHFMGDFFLQTNAIAERKTESFKWLLWHVVLVSALTWILLGSFRAWWIAVVVLILHLLVDHAKALLSRKTRYIFNGMNGQSGPSGSQNQGGRQMGPKRDFQLFLIDQALHVLTIVGLWVCLNIIGSAASITNHWATLWGLNYAKGLILLTGLAVGVWGIGIVLRYQMAEFAANLEEAVMQGLPKGGKTIGILERLLVFMFVLAGKPEGVGFVIAAKAVFRIGRLTNRQEKDQAEYIMIGTLLSFTYALIVAFVIKWLVENIS